MNSDTRVLVLSIPSWNSKVGSDTWGTLVSQFNPDNVFNIALRDEQPNSPYCNNYFNISENKVLKSIFKRNIKTGKRFEHNKTQTEEEKENLEQHNSRYKKMAKHRGFFGLFAREIVWKLGKWKTKELDEFLEQSKPDVIMYFMEGYIHFNRLCRYVKKKTGAKSIGFFVDDNFTYKQTKKLGLNAFRFFQRRSLKKLAKNTDAFWAITDKTKKEADAFFDINCTVVTKPIKKDIVYRDWLIKEPIRILYTGNLLIGRDRSLIKVVEALKKVNKEKVLFQLDVYTKTQLSKEIKNRLDCEFCTLHEPVPKNEVLQLQEKADILLFLEDIDGPDAKTARLSFSTKIIDYLSSGKCIIAVGCMETAPMQYFADNRLAIIATTETEMIEKFNAVLSNKELVLKYAKQACEYGIKNHNKEKILTIVKQTIENLLK